MTPATEPQKNLLVALASQRLDPDVDSAADAVLALRAQFGRHFERLADLTVAQAAAMIGALKAMPRVDQ